MSLRLFWQSFSRATLLVLLSGCWLAVPLMADTPKSVKFSKRQLMLSPNEGCAVADINRDGTPDIVAGTHWYPGPDYVPHRLRDIPEMGDVYLVTNGDFIYDVDGDGWPDVVAGEWIKPEICWYKNPGKVGLEKGKLWQRQVLAVGRDCNESFCLKDFDGDGKPEVFVNSWQAKTPLVVWKFDKDKDGKHCLRRIVIGKESNGHGFAFGDINGDGREDVLCGTGWYERPAGDPLAKPWKFHPETAVHHGSCPFLVVDLTGDGRNDIICGNAHGFGLEWWEQGQPKADGTTTWTKHMIDDSWSQAHYLTWTDIDGDGKKDLITGKRVRGHCGSDPGGKEPAVVYYYTWDAKAKKFTRHTIAGPGENVGIGMQICVADLNGDKKPDIAVGGKTGTWVLINEGVK